MSATSSPPPAMGKDELQKLLNLLDRTSVSSSSGGSGAASGSGDRRSPTAEIAASVPMRLEQRALAPVTSSVSPSLTATGLKEMDKELADVLTRCREVEQKDRQLEETKHETERSFAKLASVKAELANLDDELSRTKETARRAEQELRRKQADLEMKVEMERERQEREISDLQRRLEAAQRAGRSETPENRALRERLEREKAENERLNATKKEILQELDTIRAKLQEQANLKAQLEQRRAEKLRERENLQKNHEEKMRKLHRLLDDMLYREGVLRSQQVDLKLTTDDLRRKKEAAEAEASLSKKTAAAKLEQLAALDSEIAKVSVQKGHVKKMYEMEKDALEAAKRSATEAHSKKKKARAELYLQLNERDFQKQLLGMASADVKDLGDQLEKEIRRTERAKKDTTQLQEEHEHLTGMIEDQEALREQLLNTVGEQKAAALENMKKRLEQVRKRSVQIQSDADKDSSEARQKIVDSVDTLNKLQTDTDTSLAEAQRNKIKAERAREEIDDIRLGNLTLSQALEKAERLVDHEKTKKEAKETKLKQQSVRAHRASRALDETKKQRDNVEDTRSSALQELESARDRLADQEGAKARLLTEATSLQAAADEKLNEVESTTELAQMDVKDAQAQAERSHKIQAALAEKQQNQLKVEAAAKQEDLIKLTVAEKETRAEALEAESKARAEEDAARELSRRVAEEQARRDALAAELSGAEARYAELVAQNEKQEREAKQLAEKNRILSSRAGDKRANAAQEEADARALADKLEIEKIQLERQLLRAQEDIEAARRAQKREEDRIERERQARLQEESDRAAEEAEEARERLEKEHREKIEKEQRRARQARDAERKLQREKEEKLAALQQEQLEEDLRRAELSRAKH